MDGGPRGVLFGVAAQAEDPQEGAHTFGKEGEEKEEALKIIMISQSITRILKYYDYLQYSRPLLVEKQVGFLL